MHTVFFPEEGNLLKPPMPACINMMNKDVLQLLFSTKHNLQVNNLSLCSLRSSDPNLVHFCLCLSPYFLTQFLEKLGPYYLGISPKWIAQFLRLIIWLHATYVQSTTDVTLPWNLHHNWGTQIIYM